ncbi:MAG: LCP family protein [Leptolyngbyaceae cyanobacterium RM2_2_4]|nr:LCP family protein [Leptolyngbyaceae cyanobacterium SM1_4_3]NJO50919.1 LCP family protein [Leptolyngbyaceae cyanobacterium RM2_2_4]
MGLGGVAIASATAGAMLAVSLASTPLLQSELTAEEADVFDQGDRISTGMNFRLPQLTRPVNILVLGVKVLSSDIENPPEESLDLGYHSLVNSFEGLSDTMLLLRFNPETEQLVMLSLPRDTRTYVDGLGETKLNAANAYGGPALAAESVSDLLGGVSVDRYVRINVQGVEKLIDALGGVTVYVPQDMKYTDESQHLYIDLKQGEQHLDGEQALQFLRFRYDEKGDIGRVQRQQSLIRAMQEQALSPATLTRLPQILSVIQSHVDTNLSVEELVALMGFAAQSDRSNVQMLMLPGDFSNFEDYYDASYWLPNFDQIDEVVSQYFGNGTTYSRDDEFDPGYLRIAIQDSTEDSEAVDNLVNALYDAGYSNVYIDTDWSEPLSETRIIAQQGEVEGAEAIQQVLGLGEVRIESTGSLQSDVTIQLGSDWQQWQ